MTEPLRVLFVEDSENDTTHLVRALEKGSYSVLSQRVQTAEDMANSLETQVWDIIFSDCLMPSFDAFEALSVLQKTKLDIPFIIVSGTIGEETAVAIMKAGAQDYFPKGKLLRLLPSVERELRDAKDRRKRIETESALRQKSEELRQSQKMESMGNLAGGIAHDFNNILSVISMEVERSMENIEANPVLRNEASEIYASLEQIKQSSERAASLTRHLLAFSRKQIVQPEVSDINDLVIDMQEMLSRVIEENIVLELDVGKEIKNIKVDRSHFGQILLNLVVNSRDAMPEGGRLKISTETSYISAEIAQKTKSSLGPYTVLRVTDTGIGMSDQTREKIFEPFFTTKGVGKGTGLGLSTVYGIVKQNRGFIDVESEIDRGTTFKVYFPQVDEDVSVPCLHPQFLQDLNGTETILVAEDEPVLRELVCNMLAKGGYTVLKACDGRAALQLVQSYDKPIHLVMTDVVMPNMGGRELSEKVSALRPECKFLFVSGYTEDVLVQQGVSGGHLFFMEKPYEKKALLQKLRHILREKAAG